MTPSAQVASPPRGWRSKCRFGQFFGVVWGSIPRFKILHWLQVSFRSTDIDPNGPERSKNEGPQVVKIDLVLSIWSSIGALGVPTGRRRCRGVIEH